MERSWLIRTKNNHILGPVTKGKIQELISSGNIKGDDEICSGNGYWIYVREQDLVAKYIFGDEPQSFNPVQEAEQTPITEFVESDADLDSDQVENILSPEISNSKEEQTSNDAVSGISNSDLANMSVPTDVIGDSELFEFEDNNEEDQAEITEEVFDIESNQVSDELELDVSSPETTGELDLNPEKNDVDAVLELEASRHDEDDIIDEADLKEEQEVEARQFQEISKEDLKNETDNDVEIEEYANSTEEEQEAPTTRAPVKAGGAKKKVKENLATEKKSFRSIVMIYLLAFLVLAIAVLAYMNKKVILENVKDIVLSQVTPQAHAQVELIDSKKKSGLKSQPLIMNSTK